MFPLLVFCPLPSLDQSPSLLHVHVHVLVCHRDRHCAVCATHRHTLFSCSLSPMPSLEHTLCLDLSQRQRPSPQRGPKKLFRSRPDNQNSQSSLKAAKSVQKHEAFLQGAKEKCQKKVKKPIPEFVFSHREVAMLAISCLPLACPCPCLGLSQRQALCCLCHTQTHTILLFLVSHAFSRTHTVP